MKKGLNDNFMLTEYWYVHDKGLIREHEEKLEKDLSRKGTGELVVVAMEGGALPEALVKPKLQGLPPDVKDIPSGAQDASGPDQEAGRSADDR